MRLVSWQQSLLAFLLLSDRGICTLTPHSEQQGLRAGRCFFTIPGHHPSLLFRDGRYPDGVLTGGVQ